MTTVSAEPELLRIPENLFVDADLRVEVEQFLYFEARCWTSAGTPTGISCSRTISITGCPTG